jgi:hypothetical protein
MWHGKKIGILQHSRRLQAAKNDDDDQKQAHDAS